MKICKAIPPEKRCCGDNATVTLGTFDGVHLGHRRILETVKTQAELSGAQSTVVTFDKHPSSVVNPTKAPQLLTTLDEKLKRFESRDIDTVFVIDFTPEIASMKPDEFISRYLVDCIGMKHFVVGYDHGFGKGRKGSSDLLLDMGRKYGFGCEVVEPVKLDNTVISSSAIRNLLLSGNIDIATSMLGHDYSLAGTVVSGQGRGRSLGIPTANIEPHSSDKLIPATGVYAGWVEFNGTRRESVINVGAPVTFGENEVVIEAHIPDFDEDLYDEALNIGFLSRLRDIVKFESTDDLVRQIRKDINALNQLLPL